MLRPFRRHPRLQAIRIWSCYQVTDRGVGYVCTIPNLRSLDIYDCSITDEAIDSISDVRTLEDLSISEVKVSWKFLAQLGQLQRLKSLDLEGIYRPDLDVISHPDISFCRKLTNLEKVRICGLPIDAQFLAPLADVSKLHTLELRGNSNLTDQHLKVLSGATQLKVLNVSLCAGLTPRCLEYLRSLNLVELNLGECAAMKHAAEVLMKFSSLKTLNLGGTGIEEADLTRLRAALPDTDIYGS
ncbi:MAG: hypothetical protein KDB68_02740 [Planctomycetes bacterium]|nr:hypothetical protein [Planctomycetota bacterium]MCA8935100.1 hypothetical protein [Planctomycetota bacterium]